MKENWTYKKLEDSIEKVKYTTKIQSSDYKSEGLFPIVSQEDEMISGYWDNASDVFKVNKPVVIFGDHTRVLKYVDFDFVLGADGVKILQPIDGLIAKFFLYYLKWCKIPSLGYSRHYKLLKEIEVPVPPLPEQSRIVSELDLLQSIIDKQKAQLKELDNLAQAVFYDMFGDPVENDKGWEVKKLGEICSLKAGKAIKASELSDNIGPSLFPCYGGNGVRGYINKYSHAESYPIVGRQGALCGNVNFAEAPFYATEHAVVVKPIKNINSKWLFFQLKAMRLNQYAHGVAQPGLAVQDLEPLDCILPPLSLPQSFASKIESIEKQKAAITQSIAETQMLFDYTMDKYFG